MIKILSYNQTCTPSYSNTKANPFMKGYGKINGEIGRIFWQTCRFFLHFSKNILVKTSCFG